MRTKILLASLGLGAVAALVPTSSASASCVQIEGVGCVNPSCIVAGAVNTVLHAAGSDETAVCTL